MYRQFGYNGSGKQGPASSGPRPRYWKVREETIRESTIDLRVTRQQKERIRKAAALRGQTMTEFVLSAVEPLATSLVERQRVIELTENAWREFVELAGKPGRANPLARQEALAFLAEQACAHSADG